MIDKKITIFIILILFSLLNNCSKKLTSESVEINLILNPHEKAPLSALAKFEVDHPDSFDIKVTVEGKPNDDGHYSIAISHTFIGKKGKFSLPVLGLYPNHDNQITFEFLKDHQSKLIINRRLKTAPLPEKLIIPLDIKTNLLSPLDASVYLVDNLKIAYDQSGEIRWAYTGDSHLNYGKTLNGNLIITSEESIRFLYHYDKFYEVSMLGETVNTFDISKFYGHHDVWEMPPNSEYPGDFIVAVNEAAPSLDKNAGNDGIGEEDYLILVNRQTGKLEKEWDLKKLFDPGNPSLHRIPRPPRMHHDDWIHQNAQYYDAEDHSIVISARHQSAVVKFDFDSGKLIWILADNSRNQWHNQKNAYGQKISDFVLRPVDEAQNPITDTGAINFWPYGQHAVKRIESRNPNISSQFENIFLYDNGNNRNFFQYGNTDDRSKSPRYSRAVEYLVNPSEMTVEKIWEFDAGKKYFTVATGSVDQLPNQHRLIGFMWNSKDKQTPRIIELNTEDKVVFEAIVNEGKTFYYQVEKFNLYQGSSF